MALIKCPDCGKEISERADKCIFCGCPIAGGPKGKLRVQLYSVLKLLGTMKILVEFEGQKVVIQRGYYYDFDVPADGKNHKVNIYCLNNGTPREDWYEKMFWRVLNPGESVKINIGYNDGYLLQSKKWQYSEEYFVTR